MLFGLKWDIGTWLNKNVLIKGIPKNILDTTSKDVDLFPDSSFRTDRCNTCVGVFDKVIQGGSYTREKKTRSFELCGQVETAVKIFLESNGTPVHLKYTQFEVGTSKYCCTLFGNSRKFSCCQIINSIL